MDTGNAYKTGIQLARGALIATLPGEDEGVALETFAASLLDHLHDDRARQVVLNVSNVTTIDLHDFALFRKTMLMVRAMGARCVICGIRPHVAAALAIFDAQTDDLESYGDLDAALDALELRESEVNDILEHPPGSDDDG